MESPTFRIGHITQETGFTTSLLRAWERRFGILEPLRTEGGHRLYTSQDLAVLRFLKGKLDEGHRIGELAALGRARLLELAGTDLAPTGVEQQSSAPQLPLARLRAELLSAAVAVDGQRLESMLDAAFAVLSAEQVVHEIIRPAAVEIGRCWQAGTCSVAGEHLASGVFTHRLLNLLHSAQPVGQAPRALAACLPGEQHCLGLLVASWEHARRGQQVDFLGAAVPLADLRRACEQRRPQEVLLSVSLSRHFHAAAADLQELVRTSPRDRIFRLGGSGVPSETTALEALGVVVERDAAT